MQHRTSNCHDIPRTFLLRRLINRHGKCAARNESGRCRKMFSDRPSLSHRYSVSKRKDNLVHNVVGSKYVILDLPTAQKFTNVYAPCAEMHNVISILAKLYGTTICNCFSPQFSPRNAANAHEYSLHSEREQTFPFSFPQTRHV